MTQKIRPEQRVEGYDCGTIVSGTTGSASITTLGFRPRIIKFFNSATAYSTGLSSGSTSGFGSGVALDKNGDGTIDRQFCVGIGPRTGVAFTRWAFNDRAIFVGFSDASGNPQTLVSGTVTGTLSNGFSYNLTTSAAGNDMFWEAYA